MSYLDKGTPLPGTRQDLYVAPGDNSRYWDAASINALRNALAEIIEAGPGSLWTATATGSTTARTLADRAADVVNVKDFGARGDGVTDDTAAIQAAAKRAESRAPSGDGSGGAALRQ